MQQKNIRGYRRPINAVIKVPAFRTPMNQGAEGLNNGQYKP